MPCRSASPVQGLRIRLHHKNRFIFKLVFKAQKTRKAAPKASRNRHKPTPKSIKTFSMKKHLLQYNPCENLDLEVLNIEISIQKAKTKIKFQGFWIQKPNIHRFQNHPKTEQKPVNYHLTVSQGGPEVSKWSAGVLPRC